MKRRKITGLIACIVLIACLTGCAELGIWKYQGKRFANMKKREDDQHEFVRACDELKTELKKTRMYKMITRLLDWMAEKIE